MTIRPRNGEDALIFDFEEEGTTLGTIKCYPFTTEALLDLIQVEPYAQNRGIATELMKHLLTHLKALGIKIVTFQYKAYEPTAPFLESLLQKTGWAPPQLLTRRYFLDQYSFHPEWFFSPFPLFPQSCTHFPWIEATPEEISLAKQWVKNNPSLSQISPFDDPYPIDPISSLGLRHHNKLAGWMVNHLLNPDLLRYSAFFITPELRGTGVALCLLRESIRAHLKNKIDLQACIEINFKHAAPSWIRFVQTRLAPFASRTEDTRYTWINLQT